VYWADSIPLWFRLGAVFPKEFQGLLDDARSEVDFALNVSVLAIAVALAIGGRVIVSLTQAHLPNIPPDIWQLVGFAATLLAISWIAYELAVERSKAWGEQVKAAFDCYLPKLATQLGYSLPSPESKAREFWRDFTWLTLYRIPFQDDKWAPSSLGSSAPNESAAVGRTADNFDNHNGADDEGGAG
jgi:hypothetical protein